MGTITHKNRPPIIKQEPKKMPDHIDDAVRRLTCRTARHRCRSTCDAPRSDEGAVSDGPYRFILNAPSSPGANVTLVARQPGIG